ncbi:hypothetical protein M422DRAFT_153182, partial [Sphaerobolus stellatus SS14]
TNTLIDGVAGVFGVGFHTLSTVTQGVLNQEIPSTVIGSAATDFLNSKIATQGPFLERLVAAGQLDQPMFTITLQRETVEIGGNIGQLTIGNLPDGVSNNSLTWVPVRRYSQAQGGTPGPSDSPNEVGHSQPWRV